MTKAKTDREKDPTLNDDSQPSVTSTYEVLRQAAINAGTPPEDAVIQPPADAVDLEYRKRLADVPAEQVGEELAKASKHETDDATVAGAIKDAKGK